MSNRAIQLVSIMHGSRPQADRTARDRLAHRRRYAR